MIVVSDTSAISALARVHELELLKSLFGTVVIPAKVYAELLELSQFGVDVSAFQSAEWLIIRHPKQSDLLVGLLQRLDSGEAEAIALAVELKADLIIIDELEGRKAAAGLRLSITGIGGVLIRAKRAKLILSVKNLLDRLMTEANFYLSRQTYLNILEAAGEHP